MSRLRVVPIVEGFGDEIAVRILLQRLWTELLGGEHIEVLRPIRSPKSKLVRGSELRRAIGLAALKLGGLPSDVRSLVLILIDADEDLPCELGPHLLREAQESHGHLDISCVIANVEYETWFVATAHSLGRFLDLGKSHGEVPADPEQSRSAKAWIERRYRGVKYSETVDQAPMTHAMDLAECRKRSRSFDKLCRELSARL